VQTINKSTMNFKTIPEAIDQLLTVEGLKSHEITLVDAPGGMETDQSMNIEDEKGLITELNGLVARVILPDGRSGNVTIRIQFLESFDIVDHRTIHN
jgi:hypothetical protein